MKKILITLLLISPVLFATGQATYDDSKEDFLANMQRSKKFKMHFASMGIRSTEKLKYKRNDSIGVLTYESKYDERGNNTDWVEYKKNRKMKTRATMSYDDSNRVTKYQYYNRANKAKWLDAYTYDKWGNTTELDIYLNPKNLLLRTTNTYDSLKNITESKAFNKRGKLITHVEYTYYADGSKKQTIEYSGKGKVRNVWNFDCNPVGTSQAQKMKDTGKVCIHYETDKDGKPIKIKEEYAHIGGLFGRGMRRTITKYDKDNNILDLSTYKLSGKQTSHWSATYNAMGRCIEYEAYKPGTQNTREKCTYTYSSDNFIASMIVYKKGKTIPDATYKWVYNKS